jgi:hypothetical protein
MVQSVLGVPGAGGAATSAEGAPSGSARAGGWAALGAGEAPALELANALALTFVATELTSASYAGSAGRAARAPKLGAAWEQLRRRRGLCAALVALLVANTLAAASAWWRVSGKEAARAFSTWLARLEVLLHLPWLAVREAGTEALAASLAALLWALLALALSSGASAGKVAKAPAAALQQLALPRWLAPSAVAVWVATAVVVRRADLGLSPGRSLLLAKALLAALAYAGALALDVRRSRQSIGWREIVVAAAKSLLWTLPLYPVLAVFISAGFLVLDALLENVLRLDAAWLNWPIYYGTLYGPLVAVYAQAKLSLLGAGTLPF